MKKETQLSVLKDIRDLLRTSITPGVPAPVELQQDVWTLNVPAGMPIEKALAECKALFPVWRWTDKNLDELVTSDRSPTGAYTIKFKANVEADTEYADKSVEDIKGLKSITLLERILLELQYFKATGKHLDEVNLTLCAGSRDSGGRVPSCYWRGGWFFVSWCSVAARGPHLRARVAVS